MAKTKEHTVPFLTDDEIKHCRTIKTIGSLIDMASLKIIDRLVRLLDAITELDDPVREIDEANRIISTCNKPKENDDEVS